MQDCQSSGAGETYYDVTPELFAGWMQEIVKAGACIVGGCCGTTPTYPQDDGDI